MTCPSKLLVAKISEMSAAISLTYPTPIPSFSRSYFPSSYLLVPLKFPSFPHLTHSSYCWRRKTPVCFSSKSTDEESVDEWLERLPDNKKPLYAHSLPCLEAWLKSLGFYQSKEDRAVWFVEKPDWHAHLSLDVTDLSIRYLRSGPGDIEKDVERRFSYALSREDIENAILGGP